MPTSPHTCSRVDLAVEFPILYESGFVSKLTTHFGVGFAYNNDGHLSDNHRDGLTAQGWYVQRLGDHVEFQLGTGPYATMNNTTVHGARENAFQVGALTSVAVKWYPTDHPWYLRAQYNNTWVPASFHSNALLLGVGRDFSYPEDETGARKLNVDVSFWGGSSRTTQIGAQHTALAYEVEGNQSGIRAIASLWDRRHVHARGVFRDEDIVMAGLLVRL